MYGLRLGVQVSLLKIYYSGRLNHRKAKTLSTYTMKILNVAEKNDAAKNISALLSGNRAQRKEGLSKFNKIYEFSYNFNGQNVQMTMTSVSGHLLTYAFTGQYKIWSRCSPESLFEAPVIKECPTDFIKIRDTLKREVRTSDLLIIWTDCDREGENIGFEIISVCREVKPTLQVYRAVFSEITFQSVRNAMANLGQPNKHISDAVDVRSELDLRIGASFTRFQTLRLQRVFPEVLGDSLISYGSCQFPTMGFVVERYKAVQSFIPESFWKIKVTHKIDSLEVEFLWKRGRLFDELSCKVLHERCLDRPLATVENVETKPKSKWRPVPLDTVELEKTASRKLKLNAKECMRIAERLYSQGYISYPRTETNIFPHDINLKDLVELHTGDNRWGQFADRVLRDGINPRQGKKSDQAHPPIHPIKYTDKLEGNERRLYEYVVRHFLACLSKDAEGFETVVNIDINNEKFAATGLQIIALNYLEVYPYEKWNAKEIHRYQQGQTFNPTSIDMTQGQTTAPNLLTEADLIALMDKHGIGTDATHAEHIDKIKERMYVGLMDDKYFVPGELGIGLVDGYDSMGFEMSKPYLRAELENDLKRICEGTKDPSVVLREQINKYREVFRKTVEQANKIDAALSKYFRAQPNAVDNNISVLVDALPEYVLKCPACSSGMVLKNRENNTSFISCTAYPACRQVIWLPSKVIDARLAPDTCVQCGPDVRLISFKFRPQSMAPYYRDVYTGCIGGCDPQFINMLEIQQNTRNNAQNNVSQSAYDNRPTHSSMNFGRTVNNENYRMQNFQNFPMQAASSVRSRVSNNQMGNNVLNAHRTSGSNNNINDEDIQCNCGASARRYTVMKESVNKGRAFYGCAKPLGDPAKCPFFMWADDNSTQRNNALPQTDFNQRQNARGGYTNSGDRNNFSSGPNYRAKNSFTRRTSGTGTTTRMLRKCGLCRQEGHTRNNCPNQN